MLFGKYVNKFYRIYAIFFILGVIALIAVDYFQLEIPEVCGEIINGIEDSTIFSDSNKMMWLMIRLGIIAAVMFFGRFLWRYMILGASVRIESDLRFDLFSHSEKLSTQFYKEHKTGALMALFTNDLQAIRQQFGIGMVSLVDALFLGALALFRMFSCNWLLALVSMVPMALIGGVSIIVSRVMEKKFKLRQEAYDNISDFSQENFSGISVIKAFVKEIHEIRHFKKLNNDYYKKNINYVRYSTLLNVLLTAIISLIIGILLFFGSYLVINNFEFNGNVFKTGNLFEFIGYFNILVWPFMAVSFLITVLSQAKASYKRIEEFLDSKIDVKDEDVIDIDSIKGDIEFKNLSFKYPDSNNIILNNVSFKINKGEMVGIIGKTGCGKTTIVDLLLRTYNINENELLIGGNDIMHLPIKKVRDAIGYVPQDNFLFSDTIANNISFSVSKADYEDIKKAAKLADLDSSIVEFTDKYDTVIGERGVTLSGGQKQRLSIARAIVKNPEILIFDDSVSAVDTKTEKNILDNLKTLRHGKTTIMIAHRISTVSDLDKIIVMDKGEVVAIGTHTELLETSPLYQEMVHLQSLEEKIGGDIDEI